MELSGPQKAAALMVSLGKDVSSVLLKNFTDEEIKTIGKYLTEMSTIPGDVVETILKEFMDNFSNNKDVPVVGEKFFKDVLAQTYGEKAEQLIEEIEEEKSKTPFQNIRKVDSKILATFVQNEHPQTIAIILAHLDQKKAAEVLSLLREDIQAEVVSRIARLESVQNDILLEIDKILEEELLTRGTMSQQKLGGAQVAAEIINCLDKKTEEIVLSQLEEEQAELAEEIRKLMFVFEDLLKLDDRSIRTILKEVKNEDLILALKGASEELRNKIFSNLSSRAAEMIKEDLEAMGPVKLSNVEEAQQKIILIVRNLEKEGKIVIGGGGEGDQLVI
ncbi:MAG: flagellar motor switch protein FliG [Deltaproteobacteria bacterium]|nr:MAG: flagellar motor switch protein FliG [Deltaproteobacteria bacterium]